jgi:hypothetical protein
MSIFGDVSEDQAQLAGLKNLAPWLDHLEDVAEERGYFEPMGPNHSVMFSDARKRDEVNGKVLLVTFERMKSIRTDESRAPLAWRLADRQGWSSLCVMAHEKTWFRDPVLSQHFDALSREGFFAGFDQVIFYGAGMGGYAACAYSVAAPGAMVLAISPQATLDPGLANWDRRFKIARKLDFTGDYGLAPHMCARAANVFIVYDPYEDEDAAHAAMFNRRNVTHLRARHMNGAIEELFLRTGLLPVLLKTAVMGRLTALGFHRAWRIRRNCFPYIRRLLGKLEGTDHPRRVLWLLQGIDPKHYNPRFLRARRVAREALGIQEGGDKLSA